jgi:uncharacterized protein (DUF3084 family)
MMSNSALEKKLLTALTLILTTVVIAVIATYLILIAVALIRADRNLARLVEGLEAIRDNTRPLARDLGQVNDAAAALRSRLTSVKDHLQDLIRLTRG